MSRLSLAFNAMLSAFAAERWCLLSISMSCLQGAQQQTRQPPHNDRHYPFNTQP